MTICSFSVVRPVATIVLMLILIVFGLIGLRNMPVREYPDIDVPTISISTEYDGASASVVETKITEIIEGTVAGIEGLDSIESTSQDGRSRVTLEFSVNRDIDAAANDVRDRVSRILSKLPDEADSPVVAKYDSSGSPVMIIALTSTGMTRMELTDYADRYLIDRFSVIEGVADAGHSRRAGAVHAHLAEPDRHGGARDYGCRYRKNSAFRECGKSRRADRIFRA